MREYAGLLSVVDKRYHELTGGHPAAVMLARLQQTADMLFMTGRIDPAGTDREVEELWRTALT
jgi:hypothetical protein